MRYRRILLDIDDTIFDFQQGNRNAVNELMTELGLSSPTVFDEYQAIHHACLQVLERGGMTQEILHVERFRRFLASKNRDDDPKAVADRFAYLLGMQAIPFPYAESVVKELCAQRSVILLTNGITVIQKSRMERTPIRDWIDGIIISQEVGVAKPDPRIFDIACGEMDKSEVLMIGDGIQSDVLGANNAGIDVCWYNPKGKTLPEGVHAEYEIRDIRDCLAIALQ